MSNWFALANWTGHPTKGDEITWQYFEDIRRAIFIIRAALVKASVYETSWIAGSYNTGDMVGNDGLYWVSTSDNNTAEPTKAGWASTSWLPCADSNKYLNYSRNSLFHLAYNCSHTVCEGLTQQYFPKAYYLLPTQVWPLTNCVHFANWEDGHDYKAGDKIKVTDSTFAYQGMHVGYICTVSHTSSSGNKPIANFTSPSTGGYWKQYGDPVEVSTKPYISGNSGSKYEDFRGDAVSPAGQVGQQPYRKSNNSGWPDDGDLDNELHKDASYAEYQAAVERVCEEPWMFFTSEASYYYDPEHIWEKPPIAAGDDWNWDCNCSSFELILKLMGKYDWYWDAAYYPVRYQTSQGVVTEIACQWCASHGSEVPYYPHHRIWRRGWRYAMNPHAGTQKNQATISDAHNGLTGANLPPEDFGIDEEPALTNHTLQSWHANPFAEMLNDMKEALGYCIRLHFDWDIDVLWEYQQGNFYLSDEWTEEHPGELPLQAATAAEIWPAEDENMRTQLAWYIAEDEWLPTGGDGYPFWYVGVQGGYYPPAYHPPQLVGWNYYVSGWNASPGINRLRLTMHMDDPPRNVGTGGGCVLISSPISAYQVSNDEHVHAAPPEMDPGWYHGTSYHVKSWGGIPVVYSEIEGYYERHPFSFSGGTLVKIFEPESGALVSTYGLPGPGTCDYDSGAPYHLTCPDHGQTAEAFAKGRFSIDLPLFYITINKDFAIL